MPSKKKKLPGVGSGMSLRSTGGSYGKTDRHRRHKKSSQYDQEKNTSNMRKATTSSITVIAVTVMLAIQGVNLYRFDDHKRPLMKTQELSHQKNVLPEVITGTMTTKPTKNSSFSNHEEKNETIRIHGTNIITNVNITADTDINTDTDTDTDTDTNYSWWKGRFDPQNLTHPHLGAHNPEDNNNLLGWIVDPSVERLRQDHVQRENYKGQDFACPIVDRAAPSPSDNNIGIEGAGGNQVLRKIQGGLDRANKEMRDRKNNNESSMPSSSSQTGNHDQSKILCMIYTMHSNDNGHANLAAIADTWGRRCDGFIGFSNLTDHSVGAINSMHEGPEAYKNMWQKVRAIWTYAYEHYMEDYDYFYIAGDDVYMAVENLRVYLDGPEVQRLNEGYIDQISNHSNHIHQASRTARWRPRPLLLSSPMMWGALPVINGGAGYALNRAALDLFGRKGMDEFGKDLFDSKEDVLMGKFFAKQGVFMSDTRDEKGGTRFGVGAEYTSKYKGYPSPTKPKQLYSKYGIEMLAGLDFASEQQISFHMKDDRSHLKSLGRGNTIAQLIVRYHALLYRWCESTATTTATATTTTVGTNNTQ